MIFKVCLILVAIFCTVSTVLVAVFNLTALISSWQSLFALF